MKILVVDANALALDYCLRAIAVGHEVKWFIRDRGRSERDIGKGLVPKVNDWAAHMRWADLIFVPDNAAYMQQLQWYHDKGFPVYGATEATAKWELERNTGMDVLKAAGVRVVDGIPFNSFQKAAEYVKRTDARYVCKPDGDVDKALTYVAKSPEDMVYMLETWAKTRPATKFILQPFVPGIEMAVGAWVGPNGFASPWNENFEFKKLMPGDNGPATGEQGTIMRYVEQSKLADKVLKPLEQMLVDNGHIGYVDVNCIIDEKGNPVPLEFTMRPGWPHFNIAQQLHTDIAQWMVESLYGHDVRDYFITDDVAAGFVVSIPDYPYGKMSRKEVSGVPIYGIDANQRSIHLCEAKAGSAPQKIGKTIKTAPIIVSAGVYLLVTACAAPTVSAAAKAAEKVAKSLVIPCSPMWRVDIGQRLQSQLPKLQAMGYAKGMKF